MKTILYIFSVFLFSSAYAQGLVNAFSSLDAKEFKADFNNKKPLVTITKRGPYIGLQRGKYNNLELGFEIQRKAIKLIKPTTHALNAGFDYNLSENILGFSAGYWQKRGRLDLTYGGILVYKSNFDQSRIGLSPTVGFKFSFAHLQVGYNILTPANDFTNTNTLFVSLRLVLINSRNYKWRKWWKRDKKKKD